LLRAELLDDEIDEGARLGGQQFLIERLGFFSIDLGTLAGGGRLSQFPGGPLPTLNRVKLG
jgi:hypothetical protein